MQMGAYAEEIQLLLPENQPQPPSVLGARLTGRSALMVGAAVLLVAVPLGLSRAGATRRMADSASPTTSPAIRPRA